MILTRALSSILSIGASFIGSPASDRNHSTKSSSFRSVATRATSRRNYLSLSIATLLAAALLAPAVQAASINYGNFNIAPAGIMFLNVTESSGTDAVPLYGPPNPYVVGLDFDPQSFVATASGGASDITDGQLNFSVMGLVNQFGGVGINSISLFERGDYTLTGLGTAATKALAGAILVAKVTAIDGFAVAPISLFPSNASVGFNLAANPGIVQPWSLGTTISVGSQLTSLGIPFIIGATKVEVVINNQLIALSEPGSVSFIAKKDFVISLTPDITGNPFIPEPTTLTLTALALCGAGLGRRQRALVA